MPIYEFVCSKCGHKTEIISTPTEKAICKCGQEMEKKFPAPARIEIK